MPITPSLLRRAHDDGADVVDRDCSFKHFHASERSQVNQLGADGSDLAADFFSGLETEFDLLADARLQHGDLRVVLGGIESVIGERREIQGGDEGDDWQCFHDGVVLDAGVNDWGDDCNIVDPQNQAGLAFRDCNSCSSSPTAPKQTILFMEIVGTVTNLLREKESRLWSIKPDATVYEAIAMMAEKNIGAVPVVDEGKLLGILSEREYTRNVILKSKSSRNALVREIMEVGLVTVGPETSVAECMRLVTYKRVRHLPVVKDGELIGILSIGDLVKWIMSAQTAAIEQLTKYIYGE